MESENEVVRILLVEDDEVDRIAIRRHFEEIGPSFSLETTDTVSGAISRLQEQSPVDILILDFKLPDGTGLDVQKESGAIPAIFITGSANAPEAVEAMKLGASDFLLKDLERTYLQILPSVIERTLESSRLKAELKEHHEKLDQLVAERTSDLLDAYKKLEKETVEKEQLEIQLRQSQKMEAVGQLAGGIAHDFNNLLVAILGYSELAEKRLPEGSKSISDIRQVKAAAERAADLTRQLLTFSRRQVLQPVYLNFNTVIEDIMKMLHRVIGEDYELELDLSEDLTNVYADQGQMEQVIVNLCVNARDAMPGGGSMQIKTGNEILKADDSDIYSWIEPGCFASLSITDNGCGIDSETMIHIFEPFFTTKETGKGTGLGLSTVYGIVRQHEGLIIPESEPGKGTTMKVLLPAAEVGENRDEDIESPLATGGTETILLAEDDDGVIELGISVLETAGYKVLTARDGVEAIQVFKDNAPDIDFALLDVVMPGKSGREVYDEIRKIRPELPCLFVSGYDDSEIHTNYILDDDVELLQKPFSPSDLLIRIREILDTISN